MFCLRLSNDLLYFGDRQKEEIKPRFLLLIQLSKPVLRKRQGAPTLAPEGENSRMRKEWWPDPFIVDVNVDIPMRSGVVSRAFPALRASASYVT